MAVKYGDDRPPEVQLTSMLDCIFLLLIFFLVSSQLKKIEKEVPLELPSADACVSVKTEPNLVKVAVTAKGAHLVNGSPVGPGGLRKAVLGAVERGHVSRIRLDGDVAAPFGAVVEVVDVCNREGLRLVGIHTASGLEK